MTAIEVINKTLIDYKHLSGFNNISDAGVDVLVSMMQEYTRLKCLEAIKNTRYKAIETIQDSPSYGGENIILSTVIRDIQHIRNQDVMPEL